MHIVVLFYNIGGYHAARLRAAYQACQEKGWQLTAVQLTDATRDRPWGNSGYEINFPLKTLLPAATTPANLNRSPFSSDANSLLKLCLSELSPDVIAIPGWGFPLSRTALLWSRKHQVRTILMSESKWDDEERVWWKEKIKYWLFLKQNQAALVGSQQHCDYLVKLGFDVKRIFFGYEAVDNDYFAQQADITRANPDNARKKQPSIPTKPYFLTVTRLIARKNVLTLVKAFADYRQTVGQEQAWDLVICGSGEQETVISDFIVKQNLINCVHLPGFITYQNIGNWYGLANALVHPALQEQWGLVLNEACAAALPILCSSTVGASYDLVIDRQNGFLFDPKSQETITQSLLSMHQLDPVKRTAMGLFSKNLVKKFSPENFAEGLLQGINLILDNY